MPVADIHGSIMILRPPLHFDSSVRTFFGDAACISSPWPTKWKHSSTIDGRICHRLLLVLLLLVLRLPLLLLPPLLLSLSFFCSPAQVLSPASHPYFHIISFHLFCLPPTTAGTFLEEPIARALFAFFDPANTDPPLPISIV